MGANQTKLKCLYLPAQSGKTYKMEQLIEAYKKIHNCFGDGDINIIISANNILLVKQTTTRMKKDLATDTLEGKNDAVIKAGVFSWISGDKKCNIPAESLVLDILEEKVEMVVVCSHPIRIKYLSDMLTRLVKSKFFNRKINIWIDEADKSIKLWQKYEHLIELPQVYQVTLVSATFDSVFSKYGELFVMGFYKTHPECYRRLKDSVKIEENFVTPDPVEYVRYVISKHKEKLVKPGVRAFIPGNTKKTTHDAIADYLHNEHGFIVIIINGERKEILIPRSEKIDLSCYLRTGKNADTPDEFSTILAKLYKENAWHRFPLAITGFYCIQRGVTFQCPPYESTHDGFLFDYGILPPVASKPDAYQIMARLFGNIGHSPYYKPVEIYTTTAMLNNVKNQEEMAVNISRIVSERGMEVDIIDKKDLKFAQNPEEFNNFESGYKVFKTQEENEEFAKKFGAKLVSKYKEDEKGFKICSTGDTKVQSYDDIIKLTRGSKCSNLDKKPSELKVGEYTYRKYVCYKDINDISTECFITRWAKRIK
jgi:nitrate reductase NapAB chaperone NapD